MTAVLIYDDRQAIREELTRVMSAVPGVARIDCVGRCEELLAQYARHPVDVVLIGSQHRSSTGIEVTRRMVTAHPRANVIVFGTPSDADNIAASIGGGARGFFCWDPANRLPPPVQPAGSPWVPNPRTPAEPAGYPLTNRELQVLRAMSQGKSNAQIGRELYLSEDTIKTHARRIFRKLNAKDRAQAVAQGFRKQLVS